MSDADNSHDLPFDDNAGRHEAGPQVMRRWVDDVPRSALSILALTAAIAVGGCGDDDSPAGGAAAQERMSAEVSLASADGAQAGSVSLVETDDGVEVRADVRGLEPGFHGFHVHEAGVCDAGARKGGEAAPFASAMGHVAEEGSGHGEHVGDLPTLLVREDGTGTLTVVTDRFRLADVREGDGSALVVHAMRDNQANIPGRYKSEGKAGPDTETRDTGDSGDRVACGVIEP